MNGCRAARCVACLVLMLCGSYARADILLSQHGREALTLQQPAARLITLAPHLAELAYTAGAGDLLLATVAYSDYPEPAKMLPRIGDAFRFDLERILSLKPDLVLAWDSGNPASALDTLEQLGLPVWHVRIESLDDMAVAIEAIGQATDRSDQAVPAAEQLRRKTAWLEQQFAGREPLSYFYQVSARPLYTINGEHLISQALALCGGENVFADLGVLAPQIATEAVLLADPQVLLAGRLADTQEDPLGQWQSWPRLQAVRQQAVFYLNADKINRATPRLLTVVEQACRYFDQVRSASK